MSVLKRLARMVSQMQVPAVVGDASGETVELTLVRVASSPLNSTMHTPIAVSPALCDAFVGFGEDKLEPVLAYYLPPRAISLISWRYENPRVR